jgi:putative ABC transport system permease protein
MSIRSWLADWLGRPRICEADLDRELRAHLDLEAEEQREKGIREDEAQYAALRAFGNTTQVKEEIRAMWAWTWIEQFAQDLRFAFQTLRKHAGFTIIAALSLAIGIGGNAAIFSLVNSVLLRPLPFSQPDRVVRITGYYPKGALAAMQEMSRTMEVAGFTLDRPEDTEFNLTGQGEAIHLTGSSVSANLFSLLGAGAELGRTFQPGEDRAGQDRVVILSHALWDNKFGGDRAIIGRVIDVSGIGRQVVGVMPPDFNLLATHAQLWVPLHIDPTNLRDTWEVGFMPVIARLRPGVTLEQARSELRSLSARIRPMFSYPLPANWNSDATVIPLQQDVVGDVRGKLLVLLGAVGLVLLIACVNVASLLLSLGASRRKEMALRAALGAARGRIARQLLTESVALSALGGGLGLAMAFGALGALKSILPANTPRLAEVTMDWRVLAFVASLSILTGLVFGLAPAVSASRFNLAQSVKAGGQRATDTAGARLRSGFVVGEVALAVVLVIGAGLFIKSLWRLLQVDPGFRPERVLSVRVTPDESSCKNRSACVALYDRLLRGVQGISGVGEVAAANTLPLSSVLPGVVVEMEGHPLNPAQSVAPLLWGGAVTPGYFHLMGIPILAGRAFTDSDGENSPGVLIVSAATAREYWPGENPVDKHIRVIWNKDWRTVVGVAADVHQYDLADHTPSWLKGTVYMPYPQSVDLTTHLPATMYLIVRTSSDPGRFAAEIHGLISTVNPNVPVSEVRTMDSIVSESTSPSRSMMWLFFAFGGCALLLAAIGTYGVVSYSIAQRTFEIGVRMALGASRKNIFALVLGQSMRLVAIGLALGLLASLGLTRSLTNFIYGVTATDPATFLAVSVLLIAVALVAGFVPARRAAAVDPLTALRVD